MVHGFSALFGGCLIRTIVEIAKNFSDDNSYKFINAILGDYVRNYYHE